MSTHAAICLFLSALPLSAIPVFIGTNTGGGTGSKGIYRADFDPVTGRLSEPTLAADYQQPGFLVRHPQLPVLLAVGAPNQPFGDGTSSVAAFAIAADHSLKFLGEASTGGKGACHLAVDPTGRTVAVANYGDGRISTVTLDARGVPQKTMSVITHTGSGPNKTRQEGPHAHGVYFNRAGTRLYVPDLGLDRVFIFPFDPATSKLGEALPPLMTAPGAGPRHLAFTADETQVHVVNELDNTVLTATLGDGGFKPSDAISTLPAGYAGQNTTAEIELSPDGRFIYVSNRGHDSIAVFRQAPVAGAEPFVQRAPCGGKAPRHFKISPCGKWLLCAHMGSNTISVLPRNPTTGELGAPTTTVASPSPICLLLLPEASGE
jgi:6-phosphogluconolactonase